MKDYKIAELVSSADPVDWRLKTQDEWRKFPIFDQNGSGSCVAQTAAKLLGINYSLKNNGEYVHFSATDIYQRRQNKPSGGMHGIDAFNIMREGVTLEDLARSQKMTDAQMDAYQIADYKRRVAEIFRIENYVTFGIGDMETVASTIQKTGKGAMVWFYFLYNEWQNQPSIQNTNLSPTGASTVRHSVTAVDYTLLPDGRKALIIEDSWGAGFGFNGQRVITEDFYNARNFFAGYALDFKFAVSDTVYKHLFATPMEFSAIVTYTEEVKHLQRFLRSFGFFPTNIAEENLGYYGSVTAKAVKDWQVANWQKFYTIDTRWTQEALAALGGKNFGNVSMQVANSMQ